MTETLEKPELKEVQNVSQKTKDALYASYAIGWNENEQKNIVESINKLSRNTKETE